MAWLAAAQLEVTGGAGLSVIPGWQWEKWIECQDAQLVSTARAALNGDLALSLCYMHGQQKFGVCEFTSLFIKLPNTVTL